MPAAHPERTRDVVVIGCSAGGIEALPQVVGALPMDLPASVVIVQHLSATSESHLAEIVQRATSLQVSWAEQGERLQTSRVYIAPPDTHTVLEHDHVRLARTARENHSRPSIDKLFRSAAAAHDSRVIGVLLTGMLGDGVAGLRAIRDAGGLTIVQDPADAAFPELPSRAVQGLAPDHVLPLSTLGRAVAAHAGEPAPVGSAPEDVRLEAQLDLQAQATPEQLDALAEQVPITCPECGGPTWALGEGETRRFRCFLGHVNNARRVVERSGREVELALWSAVRALNDRAHTLDTLASDAERIANGTTIAETYRSRAGEARKQAELARTFLLQITGA